MPQTDRQTDKNAKATWWSVTGYNDEILLLEDSTKYPSYVKKIYGGREECPTTGTIHFQGCIQLNTQMRRAAIKEWLPTAHLEPARQKDALMKYAMKEDTATGDKLERVNPAKHYTADEICEEIAYTVLDVYKDDKYVGEDGVKKLFNTAIYTMLMNDKKLAGQLMNPSIRNFWCNTHMVWINHAMLRKQEEEELMCGHSEEETSPDTAGP